MSVVVEKVVSSTGVNPPNTTPGYSFSATGPPDSKALLSLILIVTVVLPVILLSTLAVISRFDGSNSKVFLKIVSLL